MVSRIGATLFRWRWGIIIITALAIMTMEIVEHQFKTFSHLSSDFVREILIFGVAFPAGFGLMLDLLAGHSLKPGQTGRNVRPRVLITGSESLLGAGLENLLTRKNTVDLLSITCGNPAELITQIKLFRPNVVILEDSVPPVNAIDLREMLRLSPDLQVVVMSSQNNLIDIYARQQATVTRVDDLIHLIQRHHTARAAELAACSKPSG